MNREKEIFMTSCPDQQEPLQDSNLVKDPHNHETLTSELAAIGPVLKFLYENWWRVQMTGLEHLPEGGPAFIVANTSGYVPWPALMLIYHMLLKGRAKSENRQLYVLTDMDVIEDERIYLFLTKLNFVPWSYDNVRKLLDKKEWLVVFPEDASTLGKTISMRNRLKRFDWTKFLPAIEAQTPIYPLATLGVDEANMVFYNNDFLARLLKIKAFSCLAIFSLVALSF